MTSNHLAVIPKPTFLRTEGRMHTPALLQSQ